MFSIPTATVHFLSSNNLFVIASISLDDTARDETTTMMMLTPTTEEDDSCPDSFTQKASGCFYVETNSLNKKTWQGAEDHCQEFRDNIHLADTNTAEVLNIRGCIILICTMSQRTKWATPNG